MCACGGLGSGVLVVDTHTVCVCVFQVAWLLHTGCIQDGGPAVGFALLWVGWGHAGCNTHADQSPATDRCCVLNNQCCALWL